MEISKEERDEILKAIAKSLGPKEPHPKDETVTHAVGKKDIDKLRE